MPYHVEYHFEQANSLYELKVKTLDCIALGWIPSGEPRQFDVKITHDLVETRYSQTFSRTVSPELSSVTVPAPHRTARSTG